MRDLRPLVEDVRDKIDLRTTKERVILFVTSCILLFFIFDWILLDPLYSKVKEQSEVISKKNDIIDEYNDSMRAKKEEAQSLELRLKDEITSLRNSLDLTNNTPEIFWRYEDGQSVLQQLFTMQGNIKITGVISSPSVPVQGMSNVYKHPTKLIVEGGYFDIISFLTSLEQLSAPIIFEGLNYTVKDYPTGSAEISISIMNQDKTFIHF